MSFPSEAVPLLRFRDAAHALARAADADAARREADGFMRALYALGLAVLAQLDPHLLASEARAAARETADAVRARRSALLGWLRELEGRVSDGACDRVRACEDRSALAFLHDFYRFAGVEDVLAELSPARVDEGLRAAARRAGRPLEAPRYLPTTQWWWWAPNPPPRRKLEIIQDTWKVNENVGGWSVGVRHDPAQANAAMARALSLTVQAFAPLGRPYHIGFGTATQDPARSGSMGFMRGEDEAPEALAARASAALAAFPHPVYGADVLMELHVWVRTEDTPHVPVREWVQLGDHIGIRSDDNGWRSTSVWYVPDHTLFYPETPEWHDENDLYALNHPLLSESLRAWDRALGPVETMDGWGSDLNTSHGFQPRDPD